MRFVFICMLGLALARPARAQEWAFWARAKAPVTGSTRTALPVYFRVSRLGPDSLGAEQQLQRDLSERLAHNGFEVLPASIRRDDSAGDHVRVEIIVFVGGPFAYRFTTTVYCRGTPVPNTPGEWTWRIRDGESQSAWTAAVAVADMRAPRSVEVPELSSQLTCDQR